VIPKMFEKMRQNLIFDILRFDTISATTLLHHFQHNLLHFFIGRLELSNEDQHYFSSIVVGIFSVHQRDEVADGFQESSKTLTTMSSNTLNKTLDERKLVRQKIALQNTFSMAYDTGEWLITNGSLYFTE